MADETTKIFYPEREHDNHNSNNGWGAGIGGLIGALLGGAGNGNGLLGGNSNQIAQLQETINANHSNDLTNQNIDKTQGAVLGLAGAVNGGFANTAQDINGVNMSIVNQGYQNQLANCNQTNTIMMQSQALNNTITNGIAALGYQLQTGFCEVKSASASNMQRIIDTLNSKWATDSAAMITQLRSELATEKQTNEIIGLLKTSATTTTAS